jgi:hypothetical protein
MDAATRDIAKGLKPGTLVSYETTLPVGTTRNRFSQMLEEGSGLKVGTDFHLVFSPERVFTGRVFEDLRKYPKLVGGVDEASAKHGVEFYEKVLDFDKRDDLPRANGVWDLGSSEASELAKLAETTDPFDRELLELEILEAKSGAVNTQNYMEGAVRKLNFFMNQYDNILKKIGKTEITEEDYEMEEKRYHVMTCMKQGLNAARARGGVIDEGNMIYLFDLGINAAQAQAEVFAYLNMENEMISQGTPPTHEMTVQWLEACADKFQDCAAKFAANRGFQVLDRQSLTNTPQLESK